MSLITSASPWTNDDSSKKRPSTMRKTIKMKPSIMPSSSIDESGEFVSHVENYQNQQPPTIEETQSMMQDRNTRVNDLLNKITSTDNADEKKMGNFNPLPNPNINIKKDMDDDNEHDKYIPQIMSYPNAINSQKGGNFNPNDLPTNVLSNYRMSYEKPPLFDKNVMNYEVKPERVVNDPRLLEKINYMIHLLEDQRSEKTNNITEEFILYTFLGVFIIFVVDSFSRSGKYIR
jgi:hypothetical protein